MSRLTTDPIGCGGAEACLQNGCEEEWMERKIDSPAVDLDGAPRRVLRRDGNGFVGEPICCQRCGSAGPCRHYGPGCP